MVQKIKMFVRAWHYRRHENPNEIAFILQNTKKGDTAIDIGANKGGFLYWMIKKADGGKVIAFEPQRFLYQFLKTYFSGRPYRNVTIEQHALSDQVETVLLPGRIHSFYPERQSNGKN